MNEQPSHVPVEIEIPDGGPEQRLLLKLHQGATGRPLICIVPQFQGKAGEWRLRCSGLMLAPSVARELAPALVAMAALVEP